MPYFQNLKPRPEVISDEGVEGIIDLANLRDPTRRKIESRPEDFFNLTWPSSDISKVLRNIDQRFSKAGKSAGVFIFEGLKGSGKSHLLLLIYNIFKHPDLAQSWVKASKLKCRVPSDVVVIINKFTDNPHDSLWNMIFEELGAKPVAGSTHPKLSVFEKILGERKLVLIFDELEQGIKVISSPQIQAQNIAFLQQLSEFSNRSDQVSIFASIYTDREEPGATFKRISPRCTVQFDNTSDQSNIILHRLFEKYGQFDKASVASVVDSYIGMWGKHVSIDREELKQKFETSYPFIPHLMDLILKKIPAKGGFQNVRGALSFFGNLVKLTHKNNDIITSADASLGDNANVIMLRDLDPSGDLINRAKENMLELQAKTQLSPQIAASVLLYTLTGAGSDMGISRERLLQEILTPSSDINLFEQALMCFQKYASYFHHQEGKYYFDLEENSEAKVEFKSLQYSDLQAAVKLQDILKNEIFRETASTAIFSSIEQTQELLKQFDKTRPRYVLTGRRLLKEERHKIYHGMDYRNLIILLEPKDDKFQLFADKDLLKWAKRCLAAKDLSESTKKAARKADYDRIAKADQGNIVERIKKAGLVFIKWEVYGTAISDDHVELEPLGAESSKEQVLNKLNQEYFPMLRFREHMESRLDDIFDKLVKDIDSEYRATLGFPIPANVRVVSAALRDLCRDSKIGLQHSSGNFCGTNPNLNEAELFNAQITKPFEGPIPTELCPRCGKKPCECPDSPPLACPVCGQWPCVCSTPPAQKCPICQSSPCVCLKKATVEIRIPPQTSIGSLRQDAAFRLQEKEGAVVIKANFKIFFQRSKVGDLSSLPSALRGSMTGQGDITAEITIAKTGRFPKSQIEQQIESLPSISGADYSADLTVEITE